MTNGDYTVVHSSRGKCFETHWGWAMFPTVKESGGFPRGVRQKTVVAGRYLSHSVGARRHLFRGTAGTVGVVVPPVLGSCE